MVNHPYFHVAFLVRDLQQAIRDYSLALGLDFLPVQHVEVEHWQEHGLVTSRTGTYAYTKQGPPYIELIQAEGEGFTGNDRAEGFHHMGYWVEDAQTARDQLTAACGFRWCAEILLPADGGLRTVTCFNEPSTFHGIMLELHTERVIRPPFDEYVGRSD
jgi:catechol 2,3-dioxygenase-like lactoylglutathione lyase family enzyme